MTLSGESARLFKAGLTGTDALDMYQSWNRLVAKLPPKHHLLISGPWSDGHILINVIDQTRQPAKTIVSARSNTMTEAFRVAEMYLQSQEAAVAKTVYKQQPRVNGKFAKREPRERVPGSVLTTADMEAIAEVVDQTLSQRATVVGKEPPGFTRDRDLVAYLIYKNGRVTQYELRHQYGIKNPAQAINDAELHFHFTMQTGDKMPNGDIPYLLIGSSPVIEGTMPMFATPPEDPDEKFYVLELDLYSCTQCGRHPVYRPQRVEGSYAGVCPRHGPAAFTRL